MRILVSGATGLIGRHLVAYLKKEGNEVARLLRTNKIAEKGDVVWDPLLDHIDLQALEGFDCVFHLAGKSIIEKRWTKQVKNELFQSRCRNTWLLCRAFTRLGTPPKKVIIASAIGYYGDRGDEELDENAAQGTGFLADLCAHWERAADVIEHNGVRVVHARFGVIMSPNGGMLRRLKTPFRLGLGAVLGRGQQWMSWISLDDAVRALDFIMHNPQLKGPINVCSPQPIRNREFTYFLAQAFHRRAFLRIPKTVLELLFGEMAEDMLLASARALPVKLLKNGFQFHHPNFQQLFPASVCN